jgi:hypothetical protein
MAENINEQVENMEQVEMEEIMKKLVNDVLNNPDKYPTEAKLILTLKTWHRQGPSFDDYNDYEILAGEVIGIVLNEVDEGYPYRIRRKVAIIPLRLPTIIEERGYDETTEPVRSWRIIHVFTSEGWKSVRVY